MNTQGADPVSPGQEGQDVIAAIRIALTQLARFNHAADPTDCPRCLAQDALNAVLVRAEGSPV